MAIVRAACHPSVCLSMVASFGRPSTAEMIELPSVMRPSPDTRLRQRRMSCEHRWRRCLPNEGLQPRTSSPCVTVGARVQPRLAGLDPGGDRSVRQGAARSPDAWKVAQSR